MPRGRPRKPRPPAPPRRPKRAKWDAAALGLLLSWKMSETGGNLRGRVDAEANRRAFLAFATRRGAAVPVPDVRAWRSLRLALRDRLKGCPAFRSALSPFLDALAPIRDEQSRRRRVARYRAALARLLESVQKRTPKRKAELKQGSTNRKRVRAAVAALYTWTPQEVAWAKRFGMTPAEAYGVRPPRNRRKRGERDSNSPSLPYDF